MSNTSINSLLSNRTGEIVFYNIYSRMIEGKKEEWADMVQRMEKYLETNGGFHQHELVEARELISNLNINCSGRAMWTGGTDWGSTPDGILGLHNCYGLCMNDIRYFSLALNLLMCGGGVGVSYEDCYIDALPKINNFLHYDFVDNIGEKYDPQIPLEQTVIDHSPEERVMIITVGDSRKGWVDLLDTIFQVAVRRYGNIEHLYIDFGFVRPANTAIKGFGGTANPQKLVENLEKIIDLLNDEEYFTDILCEKIMGLIAEIVVAGNIRRSARLSIYTEGSDFANLKKDLYVQNEEGDYVVDVERQMCSNANHTEMFDSTPTYDQVLKSVTNQFHTGEGAIANKVEMLARVNSDLGLTKHEFIKLYKDDVLWEWMDSHGISYDEALRRIEVTANPCFEIIGHSGFSCNLANVQLSTLVYADEVKESSCFYHAGMITASVLMRDFPDPLLQAAKEFDPIVGVSCTGIIDYFVTKLGRRYIEWWLAGRPQSGGGAVMTHVDTIQPFQYETQYELYRRYEITKFKSWRKAAWEGVKEFCHRNSLKLPTRVCTIQPAGTVSLLTNSSSGIHWPKSTRYIRRMTMPKDSPVALAALDKGFTVLPSAKDKDESGRLLIDPNDPRCTEWMIEVPVEIAWANIAEGLDLSQIPATAQLDFSLVAMNHYCDHTVSQTLELWEHEIQPLAAAIHNAIDKDLGYVSTAILPRFDAANSPFPRLPFEPICEEEYIARSAVLTNIDFGERVQYYIDQGNNTGAEAVGSGCDGMICEIRK